MDGITGFYEARTDRVLCVRCAGRPARAAAPIPEPDCGDLHRSRCRQPPRPVKSLSTNPARRRGCSRSAAAPGPLRAPAERHAWLSQFAAPFVSGQQPAARQRGPAAARAAAATTRQHGGGKTDDERMMKAACRGRRAPARDEERSEG